MLSKEVELEFLGVSCVELENLRTAECVSKNSESENQRIQLFIWSLGKYTS